MNLVKKCIVIPNKSVCGFVRISLRRNLRFERGCVCNVIDSGAWNAEDVAWNALVRSEGQGFL